MPELELISAFVGALPHAKSPRGPGDDAAVLPPGKGKLIVTTDAVVEDVHFTRAHFSLEDVGHKALAVNLSDLAAMGATPAWFLVSLQVPHGFSPKEALALAKGMRPLTTGLELAGGNVTQGPNLALTLTLAGHTPRAVLRSGARPGDVVLVTGRLGAAAKGLEQLRAGTREGDAITAQRRPTPHLAAGLVARRHASAGLDVSDGLLLDAHRLAQASNVRLELESRFLPCASTLAHALFGGEDYVLLLTVPGRKVDACLVAAAKQHLDFTPIGRVVKGDGVWVDGRPAPPLGHLHG